MSHPDDLLKSLEHLSAPQLPASYRDDLPSPEQIAARLQGWAGSDEA